MSSGNIITNYFHILTGNKRRLSDLAETDLQCDVIGEDRTVRDADLQSTGEYLIDGDNSLCYDVSPASVRKLVKSGVASQPHSLLFEPSARPFNFSTLTWEASDSSSAVILKDARYEGANRAIEEAAQEDSTERLSMILMILAVIFGLVCLVFLAQSGMLGNVSQ